MICRRASCGCACCPLPRFSAVIPRFGFGDLGAGKFPGQKTLGTWDYFRGLKGRNLEGFGPRMGPLEGGFLLDSPLFPIYSRGLRRGIPLGFPEGFVGRKPGVPRAPGKNTREELVPRPFQFLWKGPYSLGKFNSTPLGPFWDRFDLDRIGPGG